jgi:hypothetical protein
MRSRRRTLALSVPSTLLARADEVRDGARSSWGTTFVAD